MNEKRISAEGFNVRQVAEYMRKGYTLRLTRNGWVLFKLALVT